MKPEVKLYVDLNGKLYIVYRNKVEYFNTNQFEWWPSTFSADEITNDRPGGFEWEFLGEL